MFVLFENPSLLDLRSNVLRCLVVHVSFPTLPWRCPCQDNHFSGTSNNVWQKCRLKFLGNVFSNLNRNSCISRLPCHGGSQVNASFAQTSRYVPLGCIHIAIIPSKVIFYPVFSRVFCVKSRVKILWNTKEEVNMGSFFGFEHLK